MISFIRVKPPQIRSAQLAAQPRSGSCCSRPTQPLKIPVRRPTQIVRTRFSR